jgi:outer membrane protein
MIQHTIAPARQLLKDQWSRKGAARCADAWQWCRALLLSVLLLGASMNVVQAQDALRIGLVNTERILRESTAAKAAQQKLEQEFSRREKELQEAAARLKQLSERLERDASVLSDSDRQRRQREFADQDKDFQRKQREFREDLNQRRNEELAAVIERANKVIRQMAEQEKYDLILQEAVYASPRIDITDKVLRALNAAK